MSVKNACFRSIKIELQFNRLVLKINCLGVQTLLLG